MTGNLGTSHWYWLIWF